MFGSYGHVISAIYFVVDGEKEIARTSDSPYELTIILAFDPGDEPEEAMDVGDQAATEVEKLFSDRCFDKRTEQWNDIYLKGCQAISEDDLRVSQAKMLSQWRLEHLSFRAAAEQPMPINLGR